MMKFIESRLVPCLVKVGDNVILVAVRNGVTLTLPLIITPMLLCTLSYFLMTFNIIGRPVLQIPWTMPPLLNGYFATGGNIPAALWSGVMIIISTIIYYPFFRLMEKKQLVLEESASSVNAAQVSA
ncbi:hypothetical protein [Rahnella aceris]|uniref:hypothetical protein n=1 Tax=Rahnella sp. (strain Y9602) TaxID=2703885 RepID=UPI001C26F3AF|nr:hypothetical protein [Rahnella aceris]MBU9852077.1 PTS sugar transporter subunit IIC [Rahnella aceris]